MKDFVITCSSTCDLTPYYLRQLGIYYVSFYYYIDDKKYYDDFFKDHHIDEFYNLLSTSNVKTSQPDPEQYKALWIKLINQGYDILHIELSSGISGALNSALIAKNMVLEELPDAKINVVDSLCASSGYGLLLDFASNYKKENNDIDKVTEFVENIKLKINHIFFCTSLDQLIKGGRVSKLAGGVGKLLNIVPILHLDSQGKLAPIKKTRGINAAIDEVLNMSTTNIENVLNYDKKIFFVNGDCLDDCKKFCDKAKSIYKIADISYDYIFTIGTTIGAHAGKGTMSIFYLGNNRL